MGRKERVELIKKIQDLRGSRVITYITGDREETQAQIAEDVLPIFKNVLSEIAQEGKVKKIDLFLYSRGGAADVPWKIVSLIREYCDEFAVLIPFRAYSAATMIALGADEIVCGPATELGPIDPLLRTPFNPKNSEGQLLPIGTETVRAYIDYITNNRALDLQSAFEKLAEVANPLALGEIFRQHNYIRSVAKKLLKLQKNPPSDDVCDTIVKKLVEEQYFHGHAITRREAKEMGLNVTEADGELERIMWELYQDYAKEMKLNEPLNPLAKVLRPGQPVEDRSSIAFIESEKSSYSFLNRVLLTPIRKQSGSINLNLHFQLPPNLLEMIQQNPQLNQLIHQVLLPQLAAQLQQQAIQELNRLLPIETVVLKVIEGGWKKIE